MQGDMLLDELEKLIKEHVKDVKIIRFSGYGIPARIKEMDAIIFGVAD